MKQYELKSDEELAAMFKRQQHDRLFDMGDTVKELREFFSASRAVPRVVQGGERTDAGDRGKERGPAGG